MKLKEKINQKTILILIWGDLRDRTSIALALSIDPQFNKDIRIIITYFIVCFSILVQGITIAEFARKMQ